jgi:hypothetical protein
MYHLHWNLEDTLEYEFWKHAHTGNDICKRHGKFVLAPRIRRNVTMSLFVWLVADGWCWFVVREKYCWLVAGGWFVLRENYCCLVADKPSEQGACPSGAISWSLLVVICSFALKSTQKVRSLKAKGATNQ